MTTREWATTFWLGALLLFCLVKRDTRASLFQLLRQLITPKLSIPLTLYAGLVLLMVWAAASLGYWDTSLVGAVVFWFLFTGFKHFLNSMDAGAKKGFFREKVLEL